VLLALASVKYVPPRFPRDPSGYPPGIRGAGPYLPPFTPNRRLKSVALVCVSALAVAGCGTQSPDGRVTSTIQGHVPAEANPLRAPDKPVAFGFFDPGRAVMATLGGDLMISDDGGRSWEFERHLPLLNIDLVSTSTAFATTDSSLWRTDDAGLVWRVVARVSGALSFADPEHGWITETRRSHPSRSEAAEEQEPRPTYVVWATDDGGRTLHKLSVPCQNGNGAFQDASLSRVSATLGFDGCGTQPSAGQQIKPMYETHDGGQSWQRVSSAWLPSSGYMTSISFSDAEHGLLTTARGGLSGTDDGGLRWRRLLMAEEREEVTSVQRVGAHSLVVLLFNGSLRRSDNEGHTWHTIYPGAVPQPREVSFSTPQDGIGIGDSDASELEPPAVVITHDGGRSWHVLDRRGDLKQLVRASKTVLYAGQTTTRGIVPVNLVRSDDDGVTWRRVNLPRGLTNFWTVSFTSPEDGLLGDQAGKFFATHDGGLSWTPAGEAHEDLRGFAMLTAQRGFAVYNRTPGEPGVLMETSNGARTWHRDTRLAQRPEQLLAVLPPGHVWIALKEGSAILRTANAGLSWQRIDLDQAPEHEDFVTPAIGYGEGDRTIDGGRDWAPLP
jgi:photosystem II stability/assembly factor-like uncharacterized protein